MSNWSLTCEEVKQIIEDNDTVAEIVEHAYKLGYNRGRASNGVVALKIPMMSDEEWNRLAYRNRLERRYERLHEPAAKRNNRKMKIRNFLEVM